MAVTIRYRGACLLFALLALLAFLPLGMGAGPAAPKDAPVLSGPKPAPVPRPSAAELEGAIRRGVDFLLHRQNANGSWGSSSSTRPNEVYAPVPNTHPAFRAAVTSMCISALIETGDPRSEVARAVDRGEAWLMEHLPAVRRQVPIQADPGFKGSLYNNWTHAYSLQALALLLKRHAGDQARCGKIRQLMAQQIDMLRRYECVNGGWCYYDLNIQTQLPAGSTMSFMTAAVLVGLRAAKDSGVEVPQRIVNRAMASIVRQRKADFSVIYGEYLKNQPMRLVNRPMGSLGRSQACNVAMRLWGDPKVTDQVIKVWLDWLIARNFWLAITVAEPVPATLAVAIRKSAASQFRFLTLPSSDSPIIGFKSTSCALSSDPSFSGTIPVPIPSPAPSPSGACKHNVFSPRTWGNGPVKKTNTPAGFIAGDGTPGGDVPSLRGEPTTTGSSAFPIGKQGEAVAFRRG